jgi:L-ascorbate metabolism protein UlaG (beta-lactamase superfamily)
MAGNYFYLRPEIKTELLSCRWYTWPHLIAPLQHAMNITFRQLPLLKSFLANPAIHAAAARNPELMGGPFVNLPVEAAPHIAQLIKTTEAQCHDLIGLASDTAAFNKSLRHASGHSLTQYYEQMPASLRGFADIAYDIDNNAHLRFLEELIHRHGLKNEHTQELLLTSTPDVERAFFMNTPRLKQATDLCLKMPFSDIRVDALASMRLTDHPLHEIQRVLGDEVDAQAVLPHFFTTTRPRRKRPSAGSEQLRIRYFGHACVLLEHEGRCVLIDPMMTWDTDATTEESFGYADLPDRIDHLVITHAHVDHCSPEILVQLRHRVGQVIVPRNNSGSIADPSVELILRRLGFANIRCVDLFESIQMGSAEMVSLPFLGEHADLDIRAKHSVLIRIAGKSLLFLVDSNAIHPEQYQHIVADFGQIDVLFIGMECLGAPLNWLYGPLMTKAVSHRDNESRRLSGADAERAWALVHGLKVRSVFVYAMGQEPWIRYLMGLQYAESSFQITEIRKFMALCAGHDVACQWLSGSLDVRL